MKALIVDQVSPIIKEELTKLGFEVDFTMLPTSEKLAGMIEPYDLLVMRVDPFINKEVLDAAKNLKAIMVGSVGTNHIDLDYCKEKNIEVKNSQKHLICIYSLGKQITKLNTKTSGINTDGLVENLEIKL